MGCFQDRPIGPGLLAWLIEAAHMVPGVGFMQWWRFIRIVDPAWDEPVNDRYADKRCERRRFTVFSSNAC
jgi:nitroreductase